MLDRPLTSYYLLLGASALLLIIGLIMVLSASSVSSFENNDGDSYAVVKRQLLWVALALPAAWCASRFQQRWVRRFAWPGYVLSLCPAGADRPVRRADQRQQELAGGRTRS